MRSLVVKISSAKTKNKTSSFKTKTAKLQSWDQAHGLDDYISGDVAK